MKGTVKLVNDKYHKERLGKKGKKKQCNRHQKR